MLNNSTHGPAKIKIIGGFPNRFKHWTKLYHSIVPVLERNIVTSRPGRRTVAAVGSGPGASSQPWDEMNQIILTFQKNKVRTTHSETKKLQNVAETEGADEKRLSGSN